MKKSTYYLAAFFAYLIWGMTFPFSKMVIPPLSSIVFVFIRSLLGFLVMAATLILKKEIKSWILAVKENFWQIFFFALGPYALSYVIQFYAIEFTTATNQSIISQTSIFWVMLLNFIFFKQKPKIKFIIAVIIAFIGVLLILTNSNFQISPATIRGDLISIIAFLSWSTYTVFSKPLTEKIKPLHLITSVLLWGTIFLLPLSLLDGISGQLIQLDATQWIVLIYLGVVCTGLAYVLHLFAISGKEIRTEYVVYFGLMMPIVSTSFSIFFLGEILTPRKIVGGALVLFSAFLVQFKMKKKASAVKME